MLLARLPIKFYNIGIGDRQADRELFDSPAGKFYYPFRTRNKRKTLQFSDKIEKDWRKGDVEWNGMRNSKKSLIM